MDSQKQPKTIPLFKVYMSEEVDKPLLDILHSGFIGQGKIVDQFELALKQYFNKDFVLTLNNGTSGLHLALHLLKKRISHYYNKIKVLTTPQTCFATNAPIILNSLDIKWVDVDPRNMNMDLDDLARKITYHTRIIVLVHWGGYPVDLNKLNKICEETNQRFGYRPLVIEDCAHSLGTEYDGKKLGNHGNICMFSLQAIKHVTSIDGGFLIFQNEDDYKKAKLLRWYGMDREVNRLDMRCLGDVAEAGFKFHMNDVNAIIGLTNLKYLDSIVQKHRENAKYYNEELKDVSGVKLLEELPGYNSSYWLYTFYVEDRDGFIKKMKENGFAASQVHERNDKYTCTKRFNSFLPGLDSITSKHVSIPVGWWVTKEDREYIVECIKKGW